MSKISDNVKNLLNSINEDIQKSLNLNYDFESVKEHNEKAIKNILENLCQDVKFEVREVEENIYEVRPYTEELTFTVNLK